MSDFDQFVADALDPFKLAEGLMRIAYDDDMTEKERKTQMFGQGVRLADAVLKMERPLKKLRNKDQTTCKHGSCKCTCHVTGTIDDCCGREG